MQACEQPELRRAADAIRDADALLVSAGAGMGVDSGLPDFRGTEGFWRAYPAFASLGLRFEELANPMWFARDPSLAWGFYGHRLMLYRATSPHHGFSVLKRWTANRPAGCFVFTSNVDGQFQRAGFGDDRIVECHGSIHHLQCAKPCGTDIWPATCAVSVDDKTFRAAEPFPSCLRCTGTARPNVLMFGDGAWLDDRTAAQHERYERWLAGLADVRVVVIECGAGTAIPSVRIESERVANRYDATLIRINVRDPQTPRGHIALALPAKAALEAIDGLLFPSA
jgi:NAD-dependent SIR2 family protein deacetylase